MATIKEKGKYELTVNFVVELCAGFLNKLDVTLVNYTTNGEDISSKLQFSKLNIDEEEHKQDKTIQRLFRSKRLQNSNDKVSFLLKNPIKSSKFS